MRSTSPSAPRERPKIHVSPGEGRSLHRRLNHFGSWRGGERRMKNPAAPKSSKLAGTGEPIGSSLTLFQSGSKQLLVDETGQVYEASVKLKSPAPHRQNNAVPGSDWAHAFHTDVGILSEPVKQGYYGEYNTPRQARQKHASSAKTSPTPSKNTGFYKKNPDIHRHIYYPDLTSPPGNLSRPCPGEKLDAWAERLVSQGGGLRKRPGSAPAIGRARKSGL